MPRLPYMQFYPNDWLADTRTLSLPAKGAWIDIVSYLWNQSPRGSATISIEALGRLLGTSHANVTAILEELSGAKTCDISVTCHADTPECHNAVTIVNRRMLRLDADRVNARTRKRKQRGGHHVTGESLRKSHHGHGFVTPETLEAIVQPPLSRPSGRVNDVTPAPELPPPANKQDPHDGEPSETDVVGWATGIAMIPKDVAEAWYNETAGRGWIDGRGFPIRNWQRTLQSYWVKWRANDSLRKKFSGPDGSAKKRQTLDSEGIVAREIEVGK